MTVAKTYFEQGSDKALINGDYTDVFSVLGMHSAKDGKALIVRCFIPGALAVDVISAKDGRKVASLEQVDEQGLFAGKMGRSQSLRAKMLRPNSKAKKALELEWGYLVLLLGDELSLASPPLLAGVSRRASYGRRALKKLEVFKFMEQPFGEVLLQVLMGDFMQLNPVKSHTLLEAFLRYSSFSWRFSETS